jgi:hypothetical protein
LTDGIDRDQRLKVAEQPPATRHEELHRLDGSQFAIAATSRLRVVCCQQLTAPSSRCSCGLRAERRQPSEGFLTEQHGSPAGSDRLRLPDLVILKRCLQDHLAPAHTQNAKNQDRRETAKRHRPGFSASSGPAAENCSNKRATRRFRTRLFAPARHEPGSTRPAPPLCKQGVTRRPQLASVRRPSRPSIAPVASHQQSQFQSHWLTPSRVRIPHPSLCASSAAVTRQTLLWNVSLRASLNPVSVLVPFVEIHGIRHGDSGGDGSGDHHLDESFSDQGFWPVLS